MNIILDIFTIYLGSDKAHVDWTVFPGWILQPTRFLFVIFHQVLDQFASPLNLMQIVFNLGKKPMRTGRTIGKKCPPFEVLTQQVLEFIITILESLRYPYVIISRYCNQGQLLFIQVSRRNAFSKCFVLI